MHTRWPTPRSRTTTPLFRDYAIRAGLVAAPIGLLMFACLSENSGDAGTGSPASPPSSVSPLDTLLHGAVATHRTATSDELERTRSSESLSAWASAIETEAMPDMLDAIRSLPDA